MRTPLRPASRGAFGGANAMRARTRAGLAQRDRVELGRCCDLGVCHRLGAAGGLVLRLWTLWWRAWGDGGCAGWGEDLPSLTAVVGRARDYILVTTGLHLSTAYTAFLTRSPQCDVTAGSCCSTTTYIYTCNTKYESEPGAGGPISIRDRREIARIGAVPRPPGCPHTAAAH